MTPWVEALDGSRGRRPLSETYTDAGWGYRGDWQIALPSYYPPSTRLIVKHNQRDGITTLSIDGVDVVDTEDGA
jgi:hypothetical protein